MARTLQCARRASELTGTSDGLGGQLLPSFLHIFDSHLLSRSLTVVSAGILQDSFTHGLRDSRESDTVVQAASHFSARTLRWCHAGSSRCSSRNRVGRCIAITCLRRLRAACSRGWDMARSSGVYSLAPPHTRGCLPHSRGVAGHGTSTGSSADFGSLSQIFLAQMDNPEFIYFI